MTELSKSANKIAWDDLFSTTCASCGGVKQSRQSFCKSCYFALPELMRKQLYKSMSEGYSDHYHAALAHLRIELGIRRQLAFGKREPGQEG